MISSRCGRWSAASLVLLLAALPAHAQESDEVIRFDEEEPPAEEEPSPDVVRFDEESDSDAKAEPEPEPEPEASDEPEPDSLFGRPTSAESRLSVYARLSADTEHDEPDFTDGQEYTGEPVLSVHLHGEADVDLRYGRRWRLHGGARLDIEQGADVHGQNIPSRIEPQLWENFIDLYAASLDLRFGRQLVTWGYADLLSPNDVVNARDTRYGILAPLDEQRIPVLALSAGFYRGPFSLQLLWVPDSPMNRFDVVESDGALLGHGAPTPIERRLGQVWSRLLDDPRFEPFGDIAEGDGEWDLGDGDVGAQAALRFRRVDLSTYVLYGHDRTPTVTLADPLAAYIAMQDPTTLTEAALAEQVLGSTQMGIVPLTVRQPTRLHLGFGLATRIEPIGLKLEAAYSPNAPTILTPPATGVVFGTVLRRRQATGTVSLDYDRGDRLMFVLEGSLVRTFDVPAGLRAFPAERAMLGLVAARMTASFGDEKRVELRFLGVSDLFTASYAVEPALSYRFTGISRVELGVRAYGGSPGSLGGLMDHSDEVFITLAHGE